MIKIGHGITYRPFDEILSSPRIRILRRLRHFDWVSAEDIAYAVEAEPGNAFDRALSRMVAGGVVDRQGKCTGWYLYRINKRGEAELASVMSRAMLPDRSAL